MANLRPPPGPGAASSDAVLDAFLDYLAGEAIVPYPHQEEAILAFFEGKNVILNTPTGSGKSLVALAALYRSLCLGRRAYATVPIKALANQQFFALCDIFGPGQVGMVTGDTTINPVAPIVCCTAEILSELALREGSSAPAGDIVMDEFHFYADPERGVAWQIPLLTMPQCRFLLMSATMGGTAFFEESLSGLTGAPTVAVANVDRPVPLEFEYSHDPLEEKVAALVEAGRAPLYLVHFTQLAAASSAQRLLSTDFSTKAEKSAIAEALAGADFHSTYGREVRKLLRHGIGIHHAGLLPKYRALVERLAQRGMLKVICGTDTLGVGINVPIKTVLLTQLSKFDGSRSRKLKVREFHQICGRAGRRGFDTVGYVVAQAPEHVIENRRRERKAGVTSGKRSKVVKKKPPENGFVSWDEKTFDRLVRSSPEPLKSRFRVSHGLVLTVLSRRGEDGCRALRQIIARCHEPAGRKPALRRHAFQIFRALVERDVLKVLPPHGRTGPEKLVPNDTDFGGRFSIHHALGLYLIDAVGELDPAGPDYVPDLLSVVEAIVEDPVAVLRRQTAALRSALNAALKAEGVPYDERQMKLEEVEHPQPTKAFLETTFDAFARRHPWVDRGLLHPKSVAREMFERGDTFDEYVRRYGLERSEGVLLRYLSETYKVLAQTVPPAAKPPAAEEAVSFLRNLVRGTDSSLLDEWERLVGIADGSTPAQTLRPQPQSRLTDDHDALIRLVRDHIFASLLKPATDDDTTPLRTQLAQYHRQHGPPRLDPEARNLRHTRILTVVPDHPHFRRIEQSLLDRDGSVTWIFRFDLDLDATNHAGRPVLHFLDAGPAEDLGR